MDRLVKKIIAPIILSAAIIGCSTLPPSQRPIDLRDGYFAESPLVADELDLATSALIGEVKLQKTDRDYIGIKTGKYLEDAKLWNELFENVCKSADKKGSRLITNIEVQGLLDSIYKDMTERPEYRDIFYRA